MPLFLLATLLSCGDGPKFSETDTSSSLSNWHDPCPSDSIEERRIGLENITLNVGCRGSGPTVVFLHGFPEFHFAWNKVMDELASEFRLVAPDQRGYNLSDKPEEIEAYRIDHLSSDIFELLPIISPEPVILVAHDWGGPVGWMVAHNEDAHVRAFLSTPGSLCGIDSERSRSTSGLVLYGLFPFTGC